MIKKDGEKYFCDHSQVILQDKALVNNGKAWEMIPFQQIEFPKGKGTIGITKNGMSCPRCRRVIFI
jgi:hypothetical protein